jgi:integrase
VPTVVKFTARYIENLKAESSRRIVYEDSGHGNGSLGLRVSPSGNKSWIYTYSFAGRVRHMTLGSYPAMSLAEAHAKQTQAALDCAKGFDPGAKLVDQHEAERAAPTVKFLAQQYLELYARPRKRSADGDESLLNRNVLPFWGAHKADAIRRRDVTALLDSIVARGAPIPANRTRSVLSKMFRWALSRDMVTQNPVAGVPAPSKENKRDRVLSDGELTKVLTKLPTAEMAPVMRLALEFQFLTAARVGEVAGAVWQEIDEDAALWTLPKERSKNGRQHVLPLSIQALEVLKRARALDRGTGAVFPSPVRGNPMRGESVAGAVRENLALFGVAAFTPHDIRRTVASGIAASGAGRVIVGKLLNHVDSSVTAIYDRYEYADEMRAALDKWGAKVATLQEK